MTEKRRGLGRGLGALIPSGPDSGANRPVDVFFPHSVPIGTATAVLDAPAPSPDTVDWTQPPAYPGDGESRGGTDLGHGVPDDLEGLAEPNPGAGEPSSWPDGPAQVALEAEATEPSESGIGQVLPEHAGSDHAEPGAWAPIEHDGLLPVPGARFAEIPVDSIHPNARQPRQVFDEDDLAELVGSIREVGVLQPVVVRLAQSPG